MLNFREYLVEARSKYAGLFKKISEEDSEFLQYLIHSKHHVMDSGRRNLNMESVLNLVSKKQVPKKLYRGLYTKDIDLFKEHLEEEVEYYPDKYQSFSEDLKVAKSFSKGIIFVSDDNYGGFPYSEFIEWHFSNLKKTDPDTYDAEDGDTIRAESEKEWIFPMDNYWRIDKISKKGRYWIVEGINRE